LGGNALYFVVAADGDPRGSGFSDLSGIFVYERMTTNLSSLPWPLPDRAARNACARGAVAWNRAIRCILCLLRRTIFYREVPIVPRVYLFDIGNTRLFAE